MGNPQRIQSRRKKAFIAFSAVVVHQDDRFLANSDIKGLGGRVWSGCTYLENEGGHMTQRAVGLDREAVRSHRRGCSPRRYVWIVGTRSCYGHVRIAGGQVPGNLGRFFAPKILQNYG